MQEEEDEKELHKPAYLAMALSVSNYFLIFIFLLILHGVDVFWCRVQ